MITSSSCTARTALALVIAAHLAPLTGGSAAAQDRPELNWYGYVKLDAAWDEGLVSSGNYARWVLSPDAFPTHGRFNMTARQTRIGLRVTTSSGRARAVAKWEADFYGGGAENKNALQVRHAFVDVVWPSGWEVLAGQTADVISPLAPTTLNYIVAWWAGNVGYRRPQLRVTRRVGVGEGELRLEGALSRTIGDDFAAIETGDTGSDSGVPTLQGLVGLSVPLSGRPLGVGVYGHAGKENLHRQLGGESLNLSSSSVGAYLSMPLGGALGLSAEAWSGSNLDDFLGGIGQGLRVSGTTANAVRARGGWAELKVRASERVGLHVGLSRDDADADDLDAGSRDLNEVFWGR